MVPAAEKTVLELMQRVRLLLLLATIKISLNKRLKRRAPERAAARTADAA